MPAPGEEQHHAEHQEADADHGGRRHPEPGGAGVGVGRVGVVDQRLDEEVAEQQRADRRRDPDEEEVLHRLAQLAPVVDGAGDPGEGVVEGDHQGQRRERVEEEVFADQLRGQVPDDGEHADRHGRDDRREEARADLAEGGRHRLGAGHRERGAGGGQDRRLGRGQGRDDHREQDEVAERVAEHAGRVGGEDPLVVFELLGPGDALPGDQRGRHAEIGDEQQDGAEQAGQARGGDRALGLLVEVDGALPAPVDEDAEQQGAGQRPAAGDLERVEPGERGIDRRGRPLAGEDLVESDPGEEQQRPDLEDHQPLLQAGGELGAEHADRRHHRDHRQSQQGHGGRAFDQRVGADQVEEGVGGDVGQRADDEDAGDADRPAGDPAGLRADRPRHPGEAGAAVLVGAVHVVEGRGDEEHRHEGDEQRRRRLEADDDDDRADHRGQRVGRRGRGERDRQAIAEADRVLLQPVLACLCQLGNIVTLGT